MKETPPSHLPEWLRASRGDQTQEALAQDIERVTGWHIDRARYSKYESGALPIGPATLQHFVDYWHSRGVAGPGDREPVVEPPSEQAQLTRAINDLVAELRLLRESQPAAGAATAELVALAIRETLQAAGLAAAPRQA